jgi:transcriptional regulator with XRE-family HTH domain
MASLHTLFGAVVRRLRIEAGYSQESFADAIGVHRNYIGTVERGETNITLENIQRIARGLKRPMWEIFNELEKEAARGEVALAAGAGSSTTSKGRKAAPAMKSGSWVYSPVADRRSAVHEQLRDLLNQLDKLEPTPKTARKKKRAK